MWELYKWQPAFVLGFHGCDEDIGRRVIAGDCHLASSRNEYDWLGSGIYFWEGSPQRAQEWAEAVHQRRPTIIKKPFVVGAVIDLGLCLNITDRTAVSELRAAYDLLAQVVQAEGSALPVNKGGTLEKPLRYLDRKVFEFLHQLRLESGLTPYDSVRAPFLEGEPIYPGAEIRAKNHLQIAVRHERCIRGYFLPQREAVNG